MCLTAGSVPGSNYQRIVTEERNLMSLVMLQAMEGLNETDLFATGFEAGFNRANLLTSLACACPCYVICTGSDVFRDAPVSIEIEIAV